MRHIIFILKRRLFKDSEEIVFAEVTLRFLYIYFV